MEALFVREVRIDNQHPEVRTLSVDLAAFLLVRLGFGVLTCGDEAQELRVVGDSREIEGPIDADRRLRARWRDGLSLGKGVRLARRKPGALQIRV